MSDSPPPPRPPRTQSSRNPFYNDGEQSEVLFHATERPAIRDSEGTLTDLPPPPRTGERYQGEYGKFYDDGHPAEIPTPPNAVSAHDRRPMRRAAVSFSEKDSVREYRADSDTGVDEDSDDEGEGDELLKEGPGPGPGSRKRDILSVIGSLRSTKGEAADKERGDWWTEQEDKKKKKRKNGKKKRHTKKRETLNLGDSDQEMGSDVASNDEETDDEDQLEQNLSYKDRRKQAAQAKIKINVTCTLLTFTLYESG